MTDRGSIAKNALIKSGLTKKYVSERMEIDPKTLENKLLRRDLDYNFIIKLYKVLRMSVTEDFPELRNNGEFDSYIELSEKKPIDKFELEGCFEEVEKWKSKYIKLLEEYNEVLKENRDLLAKQADRNV